MEPITITIPVDAAIKIDGYHYEEGKSQPLKIVTERALAAG